MKSVRESLLKSVRLPDIHQRAEMKRHRGKPQGTVPARARMGVAKIFGPNDPDVISGKRQVGERQTIQAEDDAPQLIEVDFDAAVEMWGEPKARELFRKRDSEASNGN